MALYNDLIEEHVGLWEDMQGNVNVAGLVYEHTLVDTLFTDDPVYLVWVDQVDDGFDLAPDYTPSHEPYTSISDGFMVLEGVGVPAEVYGSEIKVVHAREVGPLQVWWMGFNMVHGPDTFFEEVVSNCHMVGTQVQAVPYYWMNVYESFDLEFHNIAPLPGITLSRDMMVDDLLNMRHEINFDYLFVASAYDNLFVIEHNIWGWKKDLDEDLDFSDASNDILGLNIWDYYYPQIEGTEQVKAKDLAHTEIFTWDVADQGQTYREQLAATIEMVDAANVGLHLLLTSPLSVLASAGATAEVFSLQASDGFKVKDMAAPCWELAVAESLSVADAVDHIFEIYFMCGESVTMTPEAVRALAYLMELQDGFDLEEEMS